MREARSREARSREARSREARSREARSREARSRVSGQIHLGNTRWGRVANRCEVPSGDCGWGTQRRHAAVDVREVRLAEGVAAPMRALVAPAAEKRLGRRCLFEKRREHAAHEDEHRAWKDRCASGVSALASWKHKKGERRKKELYYSSSEEKSRKRKNRKQKAETKRQKPKGRNQKAETKRQKPKGRKKRELDIVEHACRCRSILLTWASHADPPTHSGPSALRTSDAFRFRGSGACLIAELQRAGEWVDGHVRALRVRAGAAAHDGEESRDVGVVGTRKGAVACEVATEEARGACSACNVSDRAPVHQIRGGACSRVRA